MNPADREQMREQCNSSTQRHWNYAHSLMRNKLGHQTQPGQCEGNQQKLSRMQEQREHVSLVLLEKNLTRKSSLPKMNHNFTK